MKEALLVTAKDFLQQVFIAFQEADSKSEQLARLQALATRTNSILSNSPVGNSNSLSSRIELAILSIQEQSISLSDEIKHLLDVRKKVADAIAQLPVSSERRILEYRYLAFLSWKDIAHSMKIGIRYAYKLHARALNNFSLLFTNGH